MKTWLLHCLTIRFAKKLSLFALRQWIAAYSGKRIRISFIFLLMAPSVFASQQNIPHAVDIESGFVEKNIGSLVLLMEDKTAELTIEHIRTPKISAQFQPSTQSTPNFGYTKSAIWSQFSLNDQRSHPISVPSEPIYLTLAFAITDKAELWCTNSMGQMVVHQRAGDHVPRSEWPSSYREPVFKIPSGAQHCWLRVESTASLQLPLTLYSQEAFFNLRLQDNTLQALYFGALLVMLLYNAAIAVSIRSRGYATYTLFLLSYGLLQSALGGFGYALLWVDSSGIADSIIPFFIACVGISSVVFAMVVLDLHKNAPRWFKYGLFVLFLCSINLLLPWFISFSKSMEASLSLVPFWAIFLLGSGFYLVTQNFRIAKIYIAAWLVFIIGAVLAGSLSWLPANAITLNAMQIGSVLEFIMLSFALSDRIKTTQADLLNAQKKIADTLRVSEQELDLKVQERTTELQSANLQIQAALHQSELAKQRAERSQEQAEAAQFQAEIQHHQAEEARHQTAQALADLKATQTQLIAAEKMASLGLLVSNVAHEINTPIGAVKSSGAFIADTLDTTLADMPRLFSLLDGAPRGLFIQLISQSKGQTLGMSVREERSITKAISAQLEQAGVEETNRKARQLTKLRAHQNPLDYLPLLQHPESDFILQVAGNIADIIGGTHNINTAVEKVSRVVYALKALSGDDVLHASIVAPLSNALDKALLKFQSQIQSVELVKAYQPNMPPIHAEHDAMEQLCIHLVMNALQATNYSGKLTVELHTTQHNNAPHAEIRITDNGSGIQPDIKNRIFEPFFTTRTSGEGSGMGLAIVKRIVEQHKGSIDVQTEVGKGTTVTVVLPYQPN